MTTIAAGLAIGLQTLTNLEFNPQADHAGCRLCGAVYQSNLDRANFQDLQDGTPNHLLAQQIKDAKNLRDLWRAKHHKTCPRKGSTPPVGGFCTPEAALRLAPLGTFPLQDTDEEVFQAMLEAPRAPLDDVEGTQ